MRILFEVLERDRFEIYDPVVPAAAQPEKVIAEAQCQDTTRILKFDPATLQVWDVTAEFYEAYRGSHDDTAPLWVTLQPDFEARAAEEAREAREWSRHVDGFRRVA